MDGEHAQAPRDAGATIVAEGANMLLTAEAVGKVCNADVLYAHGKAANAGGAAISGLENEPGCT